MSNFWIKKRMSKKNYEEIEELAMDVWAADGTLGDLFAVLTDEQSEFLYNMKITDFMADDDELAFGFDVKA